jgi:hypothetical protein
LPRIEAFALLALRVSHDNAWFSGPQVGARAMFRPAAQAGILVIICCFADDRTGDDFRLTS